MRSQIQKIREEWWGPSKNLRKMGNVLMLPIIDWLVHSLNSTYRILSMSINRFRHTEENRTMARSFWNLDFHTDFKDIPPKRRRKVVRGGVSSRQYGSFVLVPGLGLPFEEFIISCVEIKWIKALWTIIVQTIHLQLGPLLVLYGKLICRPK